MSATKERPRGPESGSINGFGAAEIYVYVSTRMEREFIKYLERGGIFSRNHYSDIFFHCLIIIHCITRYSAFIIFFLMYCVFFALFIFYFVHIWCEIPFLGIALFASVTRRKRENYGYVKKAVYLPSLVIRQIIV